MSNREPTPDAPSPGHPAGPSLRTGPTPQAQTDPTSINHEDAASLVPTTVVSIGPIVIVGVIAWLVALAVTLVVPALHSGERFWWPWCCGVGAGLGLLGYGYIRRGKGNAADA